MAKVDYPQPVIDLIGELKRLPGVGPRSAERIALWFLQHKRANSLELAKALQIAKEQVGTCSECGFFATEEGCSVCSDIQRDVSLVCVVEQATDVLPLERSGAFKGVYHCLGGKLSPLDNVTPEDLRIRGLLKRLESGGIQEVILAVGSDVEGEATANYLRELLGDKGAQVSRIAQGMPAGGGLEHADELTLLRALEGRRNV